MNRDAVTQLLNKALLCDEQGRPLMVEPTLGSPSRHVHLDGI